MAGRKCIWWILVVGEGRMVAFGTESCGVTVSDWNVQIRNSPTYHAVDYRTALESHNVVLAIGTPQDLSPLSTAVPPLAHGL